MGEAKRRAKLDSTFGKRDYVIEIKYHIDSWDILLNNELIDIVESKEKAEEIQQWLSNQLKITPFPKGRFNKDMIPAWLLENIDTFPNPEDKSVLSFFRDLREAMIEEAMIKEELVTG